MPATKWNFDPVHSNIGFSVRHMMIAKVHGHFTKWTGTLLIDDDNPENSSVNVDIEAASIATKEQQRDDHLRSADFLHAEAFPTLTFRSTSVHKEDDEHYQVNGDLTIRGVTRPVVLDVEYFGRSKDPWGGERVGFSGKTSIQRRDFNLTFNIPLEGGGVVVGEKVDITLDIQAVKDVAAAA
ncbi:MAG TPA: YceI family protein [Bryobacteraceae bacterium]|nr:YceI family protein [Bryobacteraceae bacterium]